MFFSNHHYLPQKDVSSLTISEGKSKISALRGSLEVMLVFAGEN